jgi:N-acetylglucosaminyl-diphospho-decaprenol L-rhamnosyltransferase
MDMNRHKKNSTCDVVIVTFNSAPDILRCVDSIFLYDRTSLGEVYVVDNCSADATEGVIQQLQKKYVQLYFIKNEKNVGFSRANNIGLGKCRSDYVVFLNPDTELYDNALTRLIGTMEADPLVGIAGPRLTYADGTPQMGFGARPSAVSIMLDFLLGGRLRSFLSRKNPSQEAQYVDWVSGACLAGRRPLFETIHGFDEHIFMYSEDVDICLRAQKAGCKIVYNPNIGLYHYAGKSKDYNRQQALISNIESRFYYASSYLGSVSRVVLKFFFFFYLIGRFVIHTLIFGSHKNRELARTCYGTFSYFTFQKGWFKL